MAQLAEVHPFPLQRRDAPFSTCIESIAARKAGEVTDLNAVRRQRAFEAAPGQFHDFEVDMLSVLVDVLRPKQQASFVGALKAFARYPENQAYALAAAKLLRRLEAR